MTFQPFWFALQFLTRIPVPVRVDFHPSVAGRSLPAFPLVGLLIGAVLAGLGGLLNGSPPAVSAAVLLLSWVLISGALHLDGLADCADAWMGGLGSRERTAQILKDPHVGSAAVAVLVTVLLAKFAALQSPATLEAVLWAPVLGRSAALALLIMTPYANPAGLADGWLRHTPLSMARAVLGLVALVCFWRLGLAVLLTALLVCWAVRTLALARLGGVTGDVCGAAVELVETAVLLAAAL
ncbi:MAG: adenosylcobinamide-GDP ribazoletransferase [Methylococcaceae bacterium]|nr:MAG: adenosylcobinamide-GDP ribazoletransferase [Methylococcaceae bacterium]